MVGLVGWVLRDVYFALEIRRLSVALRVLHSVRVGALPVCQAGNVWDSGGVVMPGSYDHSIETL